MEILHHTVISSDLFVDCFLCLSFLRSIDSMSVISVRHIPDKSEYRSYTMGSDSPTCANSVDPDQMPQNVASDQGLYCLPLIHPCLDTRGIKLNRHYENKPIQIY